MCLQRVEDGLFFTKCTPKDIFILFLAKELTFIRLSIVNVSIFSSENFRAKLIYGTRHFRIFDLCKFCYAELLKYVVNLTPGFVRKNKH